MDVPNQNTFCTLPRNFIRCPEGKRKNLYLSYRDNTNSRAYFREHSSEQLILHLKNKWNSPGLCIIYWGLDFLENTLLNLCIMCAISYCKNKERNCNHFMSIRKFTKCLTSVIQTVSLAGKLINSNKFIFEYFVYYRLRMGDMVVVVRLLNV